MVNQSLKEKDRSKDKSLNEFLERIVGMYNSPYGFLKLEELAKSYKGGYKKELSRIMRYIYDCNTGVNSRILGLDVLDLEGIFKKPSIRVYSYRDRFPKIYRWMSIIRHRLCG